MKTERKAKGKKGALRNLKPKKAADVKGGIRKAGPGTQTEDEVYIGVTRR